MKKIELEALTNLLISKTGERTELVLQYKKLMDRALKDWFYGMILPGPNIRIHTLNTEIALLKQLIDGYNDK